MKYEQEIKSTLIDNTIRLIAEGGFESATTKAIAYSGAPVPNVKMNEAYIYRLFGSKEQLYAVVFDVLDKEIAYVLHHSFEEVQDLTVDPEQKLHIIFMRTWRFLLQNEDVCAIINAMNQEREGLSYEKIFIIFTRGGAAAFRYRL